MKTTFTQSCLAFLLAFVCSINITNAQNCACNAGSDQTICVTQPLTLTGLAGNPQFSPPAYLWTKVAGPAATLTTPTTTSTTVTGLTPGNYVFEFKNKCNDGLFAKDYITVTVLPEPPTALAGSDVFICTAAAVPLNANAVTTPNTGTWTVSPNVGTFSPNASSPNATYTPPAGSAVYTLTWTISNGFCTKTDNMTVNVATPTLPVNAGIDITLSCNGSCATLNGSNPGLTPPQSGFWSFISGANTPVFTNPNLRNTTVCGLVPGTYTLRWSVSGSCGTGQDDVVINVSNINTAPTSASVTYNIYCATPVVTSQVLTGTALTTGETGAWLLTSGQTGVTISPNATTATITASGLTGVFPYTFTWKKTSSTGCTTTGTHTINRNDGIQNLSNPLDQELACGASTSTTTFSYTNTSTITSGIVRNGVRVSSPSATGAIAYSSSSTSGAVRTDIWNITGLTTPGTYVFRVQYGNACGSIYRDIAVTTSTTPGAVNAGSDIVLPCNTLTANPIGSSVSSSAGFSTKWTQISGPNTATLVGTTTLSLSMSGLIQGTYRMRLAVSGGNNCPSKTDDMLVIVTQQVPTTATTGPDVTVCAGNFRLQGNIPNVPVETGTWTAVPSAGVSFSPNANAYNAVAVGLSPSTVYTFKWTVSNSCGSVSSSNQVVTTTGSAGPPLPNAGADQCVASSTTSVTLNGNVPMGASVLWTALDAGSTLTANNTQSTTANFTGGVGTYRFVYQLSTAGCDAFTDTVLVTLANLPVANAGANINICTATIPQTTLLSGSVIPVGSTAVWSQLSGPAIATIAIPNAASTNVSNLQEGIYEFEYRIISGICTQITDTINVRVTQQPTTANAGIDQSICNATTATTVTMAGSAVTVGTGYWQVFSAPIGSAVPTITTTASPTTNISNLSTGVYRFVWSTINGAGCPTSSDTMDVSIVSRAQLPNDYSVCNATEITLTGNTNTSGVFTQVGSTPAGVIITTNSPNTALAAGLSPNGSSPQAYTFRYTVPVIGSCPSTFDDLIVTNNPPPSIANAGADIEVCFNVNTATITGNTPTVGTGSWVLESGPNTPTAGTANANKADTILNNLIPGLYVYRYDVNTATCTPSLDRMQIVKEVTANAGVDNRYCNASSINLSANAPIINTATWSYVSGPAGYTITNANSPTTSVTGLVAGTYIFRWTISTTGGCAANTDDVQIIIDPAVTGIDAGADVSLCEGSLAPFQIGTAAQVGVTYSWTSNILLNDATLAQPTFNGVNNAGTYVYTVRGNIGSCEAFDNVTITVKPKPVINIAASIGCTSTFTATDAGVPSPSYAWDFGGGCSPLTATGAGPHMVNYVGNAVRNVTLSITSSNGCSNNGNFSVTPTCVVLPIVIEMFTATWMGNHTQLNWKIANAINFDTYEIERSFDGINFTSINTVAHVNNQTDFEYNDNKITASQNKIYYRLKLVDINGSFRYSETRMIIFQWKKNISVTPNPFTTEINITLQAVAYKEKVMLHIYDATGKMVFEKAVQLNTGNQNININNLGELKVGLYFVRIIGGSNNFSEMVLKR
jgi:Secretion system C-terminal sorting domain